MTSHHIKTLGLVSIAAAMAFTTGCANRKPAGTLNGSGVGYHNGIAGNGGSGLAGNASGVAANNIAYSQSGLPGTGSDNVVYFPYDSARLSSKSFTKLNKHVTYLKQNNNASVLLAGHADERGTREYNAALGERRAMSVKDYLTTNGVNSGQIETVSYGEEQPVGTYKQNRRVEVTYNK